MMSDGKSWKLKVIAHKKSIRTKSCTDSPLRLPITRFLCAMARTLGLMSWYEERAASNMSSTPTSFPLEQPEKGDRSLGNLSTRVSPNRKRLVQGLDVGSC